METGGSKLYNNYSANNAESKLFFQDTVFLHVILNSFAGHVAAFNRLNDDSRLIGSSHNSTVFTTASTH